MRAMELGLPSSPKPPRVQFKSQIGRTPMLLPRRFQLSISHGTVTRTLIIPSLTGRAIYVYVFRVIWCCIDYLTLDT